MKIAEKFDNIFIMLTISGFKYTELEDLEECCFERNSLRIYLSNETMRIQYMDSYATIPADEITSFEVVCDAVKVRFGIGFFVKFENV